MPIRNPFTRRPAALQLDDDNHSLRPGSAGADVTTTDAAHPGFERVPTVGSKASPAFISIRSSSSSGRRSQDTGEYKMSVVNDSGVYLPPSPVEREATWPRRYLARTSSDKSRGSTGGPGSAGEMEHFAISRESFDSYRRSFDISAKSPVATTTTTATTAAADGIFRPRQSLDSSLARRPPPQPRASLGDAMARRWGAPLTSEQEEGEEEADGVGSSAAAARGWEGEGEQDLQEGRFEDVGLGEADGVAAVPGKGEQTAVPKEQTRRRGFFAKFSGAEGAGTGIGAAAAAMPAEESGGAAGTAMSRFLAPMTSIGMGAGGRKRAQGGGEQQGAEMGVIPGGAGAGLEKLDGGGEAGRTRLGCEV